ncbi:hypothetical protein BWX37_06725 [Fusobacterium necrophorum subsp. funduliforme]|nr:hypothetical protein BWX37_06725 [Fusobacterium necrophorum subsp. funduliforme]
MPPMCQAIEEIYRKFLNIFIFRYQYHFLLTNTLFFYNYPGSESGENINALFSLFLRNIKLILQLILFHFILFS